MLGACIFCANIAAAKEISVCAPEMMRSPSTMSRASATAIRSFHAGCPLVSVDVGAVFGMRSSSLTCYIDNQQYGALVNPWRARRRKMPSVPALDLLEQRYTIILAAVRTAF